ncbi:hypothetical protein LTS18_009169, partial [Coniosporium uncinatum]
ALKHNVQHFVYSSVERGGDERSWDNETPIPHFQAKYYVERHLREKAGEKMGWTILRPVAFFENLEPTFPSKVFMTAMKDTLNGKKMQWVSISDIGFFAAKAFQSPQEWNHKALGLAGDELTFDEMTEVFKQKTGQPLGTTWGFLGQTLMYMVAELGHMIKWFGDEGYKADVQALRKMNPELLDTGAWVEKKSKFVKR